MRIAIVANYYSSSMGYIQNCLPAALTRAGAEVTVIASTLQPYGLAPFYSETYEPFLGPAVVAPGESVERGVPVTRLPYFKIRGQLGIRGLSERLHSLNPDIVEVVDHVSMTAVQAALQRRHLGYKLFTANHILASVFPPAWQPNPSWWMKVKLELLLKAPGRFVNRSSAGCFAPTEDAGDLAVRFFGVSEDKVRYLPLGVDTELFHPCETERDLKERHILREELDIRPTDIVCIYTGRLSRDKDPMALAEAVETLRAQGHPFRSLFIGLGEQRRALEERGGSTVIPFVRHEELAAFYRAADIGVWPKQESTSMMDASASGLPVVVSSRMRASHRVQDCGLTYTEGDRESLKERLFQLREPAARRQFGRVGSERMHNELSWSEIARRRIDLYAEALEHARTKERRS